ncbi:MAG TPA: histidine kinase [Paludibacter sp.]
MKFKIIILGSLIIAGVLNTIFTQGSIHLFHSSLVPVNFLIIGNIMKDLIVLLIVLLSTSLLHSISQRQQILLENERLIADNIRIRYEVLKNQVDPHFLFNSLNTLDGLIGMDNDRAHEYVQNLSQVFRYAIGNKEIVHLDEELDFTESYAHLMKIRYGENIQIQYNIAEKYKIWYIMPISLQLLVENAIKHNVISTKHPLVITIETTPNDTIRVLNTIQLKKEAEQGEGIGLANLTERYKLLFQKEVSITITDIFCVEMPLIKELEDTKFKNNQHEMSPVQAGRIQCDF